MAVQYLIDTCVVSRYYPAGARQLNPRLVARVDAAIAESGLFISAVTVYEVERGLKLLESRGEGRAKRRAWVKLLSAVSELVGMDGATLAIWYQAADLHVQATLAGLVLGEADLLILATALAHRMVLLTADAKLVANATRLGLGASVELVEG